MTVTTETFVLLLAIGSALVAFWVAARFPERGPESFPAAILHVGIALVVGWLAPEAFAAVAGPDSGVTIVAIFLILMPALVYIFLSCAWMLRLASAVLSRYRR